ncbi:methyltransferase family protein [Isoptericola sp. CG 20/1183]|uniref:Methyltransferase family protein n=1 Tax=Isoptericola halotolerans TaxID=300560 RepID=A0ABX5EMC5_9MICO|nr:MULTISPECIES: methyltransferase [Isoptericola]PRZ09493.1 methyltransferase family protein [Isoptericola sp. CG 20/1183]PRZ10294.1 methyltransferase family protein [Isoptericola halotolerans]
MTSAPAPSGDLGQVEALRSALESSGFTVDGVEDLLGDVASAALHREQALPARRVVAGLDDARATLTALFLLGDDVSRAALDAALPGVGADGAARLGLVRAAGQDPVDPVRAVVDLRPYAATDATGPVGWWLASDLGEAVTGRRLAGDHVLGAGGAALTLAQVTVRERVGRVLDLGTGCGIQALHAARHARTVVGTDISHRALGFARFNAALNAPGADLTLRHGSMLEPVAGDRFDLVVSNPPFVITPRTGAAGATVSAALGDFEYRDGGRAGDDLVRDLVTGVGAVLAPGGVAQMLGNWEHRRGEPWTERVGSWLDDSGLDGWVVERELLDPAEYAETWIRDGGTTRAREPAAWDAAYGAWLDDFASRDVEAVGFGIVTLRRPAGAADGGTGDGRVTLRRLEEHHGSLRQPLGGHLAASLAAHDWLERHDDDALAAQRLVVAGDVTEERYLSPGAADPNVIVVRQGDGLGRGVQASTGLAAFVGVCDGELTVGQTVGALAALLDVPPSDLAAELLPAVRGLVRDGFLGPA